MSDPSILTYARYFNLTRDYTFDDPLDAINAIFTRSRSPAPPEELNVNVHNLVKKFETAAEEYISLAYDDPLPVSQEATQYLDTCTSYTIGNLNEIYNDLLPDPYELRKLKLDLPLLITGGGDVHKDVRKIRRSVDPDHILDEFFEHEEDEKDKPLKDVQVEPSTLGTEILVWLQNQARLFTGQEKMDITQHALNLLKEALHTHIGAENIWETMQNLLPQGGKADYDASPISPDDFDLEDDDEPPDVPEPPDKHKTSLADLLCVAEQDPGLPRRLDLESNEDFLLGNTQVDREMEELLREFTNYDTLDLDTLVDSTIIDEYYYDELPAAKKRKLEHKPNDEVLTAPSPQTEKSDATTARYNFKISTPSVPEYSPFRLPDINLSNTLTLVASNESIDRTLPVPPFQTPTVHEVICKSMPAASATYKKYVTDDKNITSSDQHLWKEPGIRILDLEDADEQDIDSDNFDIEDVEQEKSMKEEPRKMQPLDPTKIAHDVSAASMNENEWKEKHDESLMPMNGPVLEDVVQADESLTGGNVDHLKTSSSPAKFSPLTCRARHTLPELDTKPENNINDPGAQHATSLYQSRTQQSHVNNTAASQHATDRQATSFRSLLPKSKHGRPAPNIAVKKEYKLDDSLANFLDLRGKQFKFPIPKLDAVRAVDIVDDPIQSTQDLSAKICISEEKLLSPRPVNPIETTQSDEIPPITPLQEASTIIVNNTLLETKKTLIQSLERIDEAKLTLVYRDLDLGRNHGPDIILNSTSCLFITNLQSLNQRPLPGQKSITGLSSAHDQVASLAQSYSQVVVLVHHILATDRELQSRSLSAQASFSGFCLDLSRSMSSSSTRIQSYWLPCTDPASTSKVVNAWVWQVIASYAHRDTSSLSSKSSTQPLSASSPMIPDETLWEVFLCKAGLNPMAAQIVLGSLRKPDGRNGEADKVEQEQEPTWGLRRLVAMGSRERVRLFAEKIGLDAVKRLNEVFSDTGHVK